VAGKKKKKKRKGEEKAPEAQPNPADRKLSRKEFDLELRKLRHMQEWVKREGLRIIVVFEGRDAAGKGGVIKRITERVSPRVFRVVALPAPSDRERSQLFIQRYIQHFPAAGEVILFDRSWYNRAGVERVMDFCTDQEYERFLEMCPSFEKDMVESGLILVKYFFDVSREVQEERFKVRMKDPLRHWKLSPMDVESWQRWWHYTGAYHRMLEATDTPWAPWVRVPADDKRRARLNCISHLLSVVPYEKQHFVPPKTGKRLRRPKGVPTELTFRQEVPQIY
jgi:polyphosphate kinase 2